MSILSTVDDLNISRIKAFTLLFNEHISATPNAMEWFAKFSDQLNSYKHNNDALNDVECVKIMDLNPNFKFLSDNEKRAQYFLFKILDLFKKSVFNLVEHKVTFNFRHERAQIWVNTSLAPVILSLNFSKIVNIVSIFETIVKPFISNFMDLSNVDNINYRNLFSRNIESFAMDILTHVPMFAFDSDNFDGLKDVADDIYKEYERLTKNATDGVFVHVLANVWNQNLFLFVWVKL